MKSKLRRFYRGQFSKEAVDWEIIQIHIGIDLKMYGDSLFLLNKVYIRENAKAMIQFLDVNLVAMELIISNIINDTWQQIK